MKSIGQRIKELREDENLSQSVLGKELGISRNSIATYENDNSTPSVDVIIKYANFFSVTTDYILGRTKEKNIIKKQKDNISVEYRNSADEKIIDKFIEFLKNPEIVEFVNKRLK